MPQPLWNIECLETLSQIVPKGHRSSASYATENTSRDKDRGSVSKGVGLKTPRIRQVKQDRDKRICYTLGPIDRVREGSHVPPNPEHLEHSIFQFPQKHLPQCNVDRFSAVLTYSNSVHRPDAVLGFGRNAPGSPLICHLSGSRTCSAAPIGPQSAPHEAICLFPRSQMWSGHGQASEPIGPQSH